MEADDTAFEPASLMDEPAEFITMATCAIASFLLIAMTAGLSNSMLSFDPLMLHVKIRAASSSDSNKEEKRQAEAVLPLVQQYHLLLVTILLFNSIMNQALPMVLNDIMSPVASVTLSVVFVLL